MKLLDLLAKEIRSSAQYNSSSQVAPSVILWTDKLRQWESALPLLQAAMPELVVLGDYQPEKKTGPAIWIKCVLENVLDTVSLPDDKTPVLYLPGVERRDLRAIASCPEELMPLAELQYRGSWWTYNSSGRDWTVRSFLVSASNGAGLDVASDEKSQQAMLRVLPEILESNIRELTGRRLEASDFNKLVSVDPTRDLLTWMNDPKATRERWDESRWQALVGICQTEYRFHPEQDGELIAAELLCQHQGLWEAVWLRFLDSSQQYPNLPDLLLRVPADLIADGASYPQVNKRDEDELEQELSRLLQLNAPQVRSALQDLEKRHGIRRSWIWFELGLSPLAGVLKYLAPLAELTSTVFSGTQPQEMAEQYRQTYWRADDLLLKALACNLPNQYQAMVQNILNLIYTPWLDEVTKNFQQLVQTRGYPGMVETNEAVANYAAKGEVVFFVDGLRYDLAHRLSNRLQTLGEVRLSSNWSALPSVTATAKAAITPVHERLSRESDGRDFVPSIQGEDSSFSAYYLKKFLQEQGWQYLEDGQIGNPDSNAWVQNGDIDREGHVRGIKLAARVDSLLAEVVERVEELVAGGWRKIRIVTDHGWMLIPTPMPKVELPKYLTETRWGRCAVLKDNTSTQYLHVGWHWNNQVSIAMAPGVTCFKAGLQYDHGGLSLQECLTPVLELLCTQTQAGNSQVTATLTRVRWMGLVCRVQAETDAAAIYAVLRTRPADATSELCEPKQLKDGKCSLMIDDEHEGASAVLVLLDEQGSVLARQATLVGDE